MTQSSGLCKDCRFYEDSQVLSYRNWKQCARTQSFPTDVSDERSGAVAFARTAFTAAILYTAPDFGCVMFEARADEK